MPVADVGEYFDAALSSILEQTFADLEVILLLNGRAIDEGPAIRERHPDPRVTIAACGLRQAAYARNRAFDLSSGEYVAAMDADDISEPDRIAAQVALLDAQPDIGVVGTQVIRIDARGVPLPKQRRLPVGPEALRRMQWWEGGVAAPSVMMRRGVFVSAGGYAAGVEDLDLWLRMRRDGVRFANVDRPLLRYRHHPNQTSTRDHRRVTSEVFGLFMREAAFATDPRFLAGAVMACASRFLRRVQVR
jgi:glycosyltransferase involved in cell wall biosynthesis